MQIPHRRSSWTTRWGSHHKDVEVYFNLLVDLFSFSVGLGVVGGGEGEVISEGFSKLFGKGRGELGTLVGDDFIIETESSVDFVEKEQSYS